MKAILVALIAGIMMVGCATKEVVVEKPVVVAAPVWKFQKLKAEVQGKLEVNVKSKEEQRICTPYVVEATDKMYSVIDALEEQFDMYEAAMEEYNSSIK